MIHLFHFLLPHFDHTLDAWTPSIFHFHNQHKMSSCFSNILLTCVYPSHTTSDEHGSTNPTGFAGRVTPGTGHDFVTRTNLNELNLTRNGQKLTEICSKYYLEHMSINSWPFWVFLSRFNRKYPGGPGTGTRGVWVWVVKKIPVFITTHNTSANSDFFAQPHIVPHSFP